MKNQNFKSVAVLILTLTTLLINTSVFSQSVGISGDYFAIDSSALLELKDTTKGFLMTRLTTTQRDAISSPAEGLQIFNTTTKCLEIYIDGQWQDIFCSLNCAVAPSTPGAITGNTTPCENATGESYSIVQVSGATSYTWTAPSGATITSGQGTTGITVTFGVTSGNITVTASNSCGTSSAQTLATTLITVPAQPSVITPGTGTTICSGVGQTYTVTNVAGTTYTWTYSGTGWSQTGGGTTNSITASATGSGTVTATPSNSCGNGTARTLGITVIDVPAQPSVITGTTPVCQGNNGVAYSVTNVGGVTYTWTYSGTGYTQASGGTTNSITANFSATATSGTLTVTPSNSCGNGTARTFAITVSATPTTANAGSDINPACDATTTTLAGNTPAVGTGAWSVISGTANITTPSSPTSGVTGLVVPGTTTLRWTISNSPCTASTDDVVITTSACSSCIAGSSCGSATMTDARDSKVYDIMQFGTQCWMTENLNYGTYVTVATGQAGGSKKYCYDDNTSNCDTYGGLYEWPNLMNGSSNCNGNSSVPKCSTPVQGLCPSGWHLPSYYEWILLFKNLGGCPECFSYSYTIGEFGPDEMDCSLSGGGTGFDILYGGRTASGSFMNVGALAAFWSTSSTDGGSYAWGPWVSPSWFPGGFYLNSASSTLGAFGLSARCVKD